MAALNTHSYSRYMLNKTNIEKESMLGGCGSKKKEAYFLSKQFFYFKFILTLPPQFVYTERKQDNQKQL